MTFRNDLNKCSEAANILQKMKCILTAGYNWGMCLEECKPDPCNTKCTEVSILWKILERCSIYHFRHTRRLRPSAPIRDYLQKMNYFALVTLTMHCRNAARIAKTKMLTKIWLWTKLQRIISHNNFRYKFAQHFVAKLNVVKNSRMGFYFFLSKSAS